MFSATSVCLSISALAIPLRNYLKTTFLLSVCSHSAPIPMLSELLLGLKTAWLTSTTCCLYFHPSPREEMYVKSSVFKVVCFYCYCGFFVAQVKNYLIRDLVQKMEIFFRLILTNWVSSVPLVGGRAQLKGLPGATTVLPSGWEMVLPHSQQCQGHK